MIGVSMPRRYGKTQSVAQHTAATLICMETPYTVPVFSVSSRASKMMVKITAAVCLKLDANIHSEIIVCNCDTLCLENPITKVQRTMMSYPGGVRISYQFFLVFFLLFLCHTWTMGYGNGRVGVGWVIEIDTRLRRFTCVQKSVSRLFFVCAISLDHFVE